MMTVDELGLRRCHLIKIDVEGMEGDVLAGAAGTIQRLCPVLYVENDRPERSAELIGQLLSMDYRLYWHLSPLFNPANYFGESEDIFGPIVSTNMLGLHRSSKRRALGLRQIKSPDDGWCT